MKWLDRRLSSIGLYIGYLAIPLAYLLCIPPIQYIGGRILDSFYLRGVPTPNLPLSVKT